MKRMIKWGARLLAITVLGFMAGCEDDQDTTKREVRVYNESAGVIHVLVDGAEMMVVPPSDNKWHRVSVGLHKVELTTDDGHEIWEQYIDLAEGQYAKFKVNADGSVLGSGGLTYDPSEGNGSYSSGEDPQLRVSNHMADSVHIWVDGSEKKVVPSGDMRSVNPGDGQHLVELMTSDGQSLFSQSVLFKDGQYILYTIENDGNVVASGGML